MSSRDVRKAMILKKLAQMDCASLDPAEIERCLRGCVAARKLTELANDLAAKGEIKIEHVRSVP